jgi:hypothetical protein
MARVIASATIAAVLAAGPETAVADPPPIPQLFRSHLLDHEPGLYRGHTAEWWAGRYKTRTRQLQAANTAVRQLHRTVLHKPSTAEAINLACAVYGSCSTLWRRARCESGLNPWARNASGASGLFQFLSSTWRTTPFGSFSIFSPFASALAAGWMETRGRGSEWVCR